MSCHSFFVLILLIWHIIEPYFLYWTIEYWLTYTTCLKGIVSFYLSSYDYPAGILVRLKMFVTTYYHLYKWLLLLYYKSRSKSSKTCLFWNSFSWNTLYIDSCVDLRICKRNPHGQVLRWNSYVSFLFFYRCLPLSASDLHTVLSSSRYSFTCESHTFCFLFALPCLVFWLRSRWFLPLVTKGCKYCTTSVVSKALWFYFILHDRSISW